MIKQAANVYLCTKEIIPLTMDIDKLKEELNGYIVLSSDGSSKILLHNNKYCAMKNLSDKTINIVSIADAECYIN